MREDLADYLVHFTKGNSDEEAYLNLVSIIKQRQVNGSNKNIKDGSNCICFSETPLVCLNDRLVNLKGYSCYSGFGILAPKKNVFELGGRPVIYQPDSEFKQLNNTNSWRHVRYDPPDVDFTWEREWRLKEDYFLLDPGSYEIVVPNKDWEDRLNSDYYENQKQQTMAYSLIMDELLAIMYEEDCPTILKITQK